MFCERRVGHHGMGAWRPAVAVLPPGSERTADQLIALLLALSFRQAGVCAVVRMRRIMPAIGDVELLKSILSSGLLDRVAIVAHDVMGELDSWTWQIRHS